MPALIELDEGFEHAFVPLDGNTHAIIFDTQPHASADAAGELMLRNVWHGSELPVSAYIGKMKDLAGSG